MAKKSKKLLLLKYDGNLTPQDFEDIRNLFKGTKYIIGVFPKEWEPISKEEFKQTLKDMLKRCR